MSLYNNKSTIQSVINSGIDNKMTVRELSLKEVLVNSAGEKFVINMFNLFEKYYELLMDNSIIVVLSDEEYNKVIENAQKDIKKELETWKKTAEKLAEELRYLPIPADGEVIEFATGEEYIDWARKEVENENKIN